MAPAIASLISGGVQAAGGIVGNLLTNHANKKLAESSFQHDVDMWNAANEYNQPVNQMQRLQEAGLNPNLVYGNGSVVGNTSTETPKYHAPTLDYKFDFAPALNTAMGVMNMYQDLQLKSAQTDNLKAQKMNTDADTTLKGLMGTGVGFENQMKQVNSRLATKLERNSYDTAQQNLVNLRQMSRKIAQDIISSQQGVEESKARTTNLNIDTDIKNKQKSMWDKGINPSDNWVGRSVQNTIINLGDYLNRILNPDKGEYKGEMNRYYFLSK